MTLMDNRTKNQYLPDFVTPPGDSLRELLRTLGMSQVSLAERTGRSPKTINEIVKGKAPITPETAIQFETVLGVPAVFWNNREKNYREALAQKNERKYLKTAASWISRFPTKEMARRGWIQNYTDQVSQVRELLQFFSVAGAEQWENRWLKTQVSYRKSTAFQVDPYALAAWIRQGENAAHQVKAAPYDLQKFRNALKEVRKLTTESPEIFVPRARDICAASGVAVVFIQELPKIRTYGVTYWINPDKALIQLCLRYKTNDHFWFTFFHEAGHILLHGKRDVFLEEEGKESQKENEANRFAADVLIPPSEWQRFITRGLFIESEIVTFSKSARIHPGIVVGRLQHEKRVPFSHLNRLKMGLCWVSSN